MSYRLVIVESPAKTSSFEKALGPAYKCMASFGHIRELKKLTDIDRDDNYKPSYTNSYGKLKQIKKLQDAARKSNGVVLATDDDKEGEAIAWHLCQVLRLPVSTTPRLIFHEVTPTAIQAAIQNPSVINMNKVHAAQARQILDMLVGFQISPLLWNRFGGQLALSAGRCQTPALRLVYENQQEIDKSPGKIAYTTTGLFTQKAIPFTLNHQHESEESMSSFLETTVTSEHEHNLTIEKESTATKSQPKPFTTSSMQQSANTELRISPKEAMSICQKLYERGLITYMRTDSRTYSKEFIGSARSYIGDTYGEKFMRPDVFSLAVRVNDTKSSKKSKTTKTAKKESSAQEAHEAIRPTNVRLSKLDQEKFSPRERKLYQMIWRNTVESCMKVCTVVCISAKVSAPEGLAYKASQEEVVDPGWKIVGGYERENLAYRFLVSQRPQCPKSVDYNKITSRLGVKDSKGHYTEAKLVQLLEERGIGRPSTFSSLVEKIQERGYVKRGDVEGKPYNGVEFELIGEELTESEVSKSFGGERNKLILQPLGATVWEYLSSQCGSLFDYEYTKRMESDLDAIEGGEKVWHTLCSECDGEVTALTSEVREAIKKAKEAKKAKKSKKVDGGDDDEGQRNDDDHCDDALKQQRFGCMEIQIDDEHTYTVTKYGPVVVSVVDGKKVYQGAKQNIDVESIRNGSLSVSDIVDEKKTAGGKNLGEYGGFPVLLKSGKYGAYVQWNGKNVSVKKLGRNESAINISRVIPLLEASSETKFRELTKVFSVRVGKSPYVFYKTTEMKKPKFLSLKGFDEDPFTCNENVLFAWLETKHKIKQS
jgi:DNA topoisomerase-1